MLGVDEKAHFGWITRTLRHSPLLFYPYYFVFATSACYHMLYGSPQALSVLTGYWPLRSKRVRYALTGGFAAVVACALLAFAGAFHQVPRVPDSLWVERILPAPLRRFV